MVATEIIFQSLGQNVYYFSTFFAIMISKVADANNYSRTVWDGPGLLLIILKENFRKTLGQSIGETFIPATLISLHVQRESPHLQDLCT